MEYDQRWLSQKKAGWTGGGREWFLGGVVKTKEGAKDAGTAEEPGRASPVTKS